MVKLSSALAVCAALSVASAAATLSPTKTLIPGPGFPTLEELGITLEDLAHPPHYNSDTSEADAASKSKTTSTSTTTTTSTATTTPTCIPENRCKVQDADLCINYLRHIGKQNCTVHGKVELETVEYGTAKIYLGQREFGTGTILCKYVAQYAANVRKNCKKKGHVSGQQSFPKQIFSAKGYIKNNNVLFVDLRQYNGSSSAR